MPLIQPMADPIKPVHIRPRSGLRLLALGEIWEARQLLLLLARRDIRVRYQRPLLGMVWVLLQAGITAALAALAFGGLETGPDSRTAYAISVAAGMLPWLVVARGISEGGTSLSSNNRLVARTYFPRPILPLAATVAALPDAAILLVVVLAAALACGQTPGWPVLLLPLFLLHGLIAACGLAWAIAAFDGMYRDVRMAIPFTAQFALLATPVLWPPAMADAPHLRWLVAFNPAAGAVVGARWSLGGGAPPDPATMACSAAAAVATLVLGLWVFRQAERAIADAA
jgi:lipopolysaccharide transport system permease protein